MPGAAKKKKKENSAKEDIIIQTTSFARGSFANFKENLINIWSSVKQILSHHKPL